MKTDKHEHKPAQPPRDPAQRLSLRPRQAGSERAGTEGTPQGQQAGQMMHFFEHVRGGFSIHVEGEGPFVPAVRFCLARFGEDADRVLTAFWQEVGAGDFEVVPLFSLRSRTSPRVMHSRSLAAALQTVSIEPRLKD